MSFRSRALALAMVLPVLVPLAGGASGSQALHARKQQTVRTVALQQGLEQGTQLQQLLDSAAHASALVSIEASTKNPRAVVVHLEGRPAYNSTVMDGGRKIVLDLFETVNLMRSSRIEGPQGHGVAAVRNSLYALDPSITARIVCDMRAPSRLHSVERVDEGLRLEFAAASQRSSKPTVQTGKSRPELEPETDASFKATRAKIEKDHMAVLEAAERARAMLDQVGSGNLSTQWERQLDDGLLLANQAILNNLEAVSLLKTRQDLGVLPEREVAKRLDAIRAACARESEGAINEFQQIVAFTESTHGEPDADTMRTLVASLETLGLPRIGTPDGTDAKPIEKMGAKESKAAVNAVPVREASPQDAMQVASQRTAERSQRADSAQSQRTHNLEMVPVELIAESLRRTAASASRREPRPTAKPSIRVQDQNADRRVASVPPVNIGELTQGLTALAALGDEPVAQSPDGEDNVGEDLGADALSPQEVQDDAAPQAEVEAEQAPDAGTVESVEAQSAEEPAAQPEPSDTAPAGSSSGSGQLSFAATQGVDDEAIPQFTAKEWDGDPLQQPIDFQAREMELANFVALLARKAGVNVVAGTAVTGTVTLSLREVPLKRAIEVALQQNGLGIIEEGNIFRIVPYNEAASANRVTRTINLENAEATELANTLQNVLIGGPGAELMSITPNDKTNLIIIAGPAERVDELAHLTREMDVSEPALPTATEALPLNYAEPAEIQPIIESMLTPEVGAVEVDPRSRKVIVTDVPVVIEQVRELISTIDTPIRQVSIHAMVVDAVLRDESQIGTQWLVDVLRRRSRNGELVSNLSRLDFEGNLGTPGTGGLDAGILNVGVLSSEFDIAASIAAEVASGNSEILANPVISTLENRMATISLAQEFPYQEITQSTQGPPVSSTEFKDIGVVLEVTPRVTHDKHVIVDLNVKQSSVSGLTQDGIPIEDKRTAQNTIQVNDGQTIFIGGLRNVTDRLDTSKIPVLGDVPILNFMFKTTDVEKIHSELMIFLTCDVIEDEMPAMSERQQNRYEKMEDVPDVPSSQGDLYKSFLRPGSNREPFWELDLRRTE